MVNAHIAFDLDFWPNNRLNNFKFKNFLFDATNIFKKIVIKKSGCIIVMEEQVHGTWVKILLRML